MVVAAGAIVSWLTFVVTVTKYCSTSIKLHPNYTKTFKYEGPLVYTSRQVFGLLKKCG